VASLKRTSSRLGDAMEWVADGGGSIEQRRLLRVDGAGDTRGLLADFRALLGSQGVAAGRSQLGWLD
jgi:hypothetical protein